MLGRSKCEVLSCVDLKDAFHSLGLTDKAKEFCGILPYFEAHIIGMKYSLWDFL